MTFPTLTPMPQPRVTPRRANGERMLTGYGYAQWRARMGFSKQRAALVLGISRHTGIDYESGKYAIPRYVALACAAIEAKLKPTV